MNASAAAWEVRFHPVESLVAGRAHPACSACVILPVRNEETTVAACLDAFSKQVGLNGIPLHSDDFELLLLLNNCSDRSATVVHRWKAEHPEIVLHSVERALPPAEAHAGTARRLLMDTALNRLQDRDTGSCAILSTDADSVVAPDWIAQNLAALERGADAVGGAIDLHAKDLASLPEQVRWCYGRDRRYAELIAQLEDLLDPQPGDPWPRHLDHFGSSLACTPAAYLRAGGMPAAPALEDEAFVDRLRRAGLHLRHEPAVRVCTSARLKGRAEVGLAGQLRQWNEFSSRADHTVQSAGFLAHRFHTLRRLREAFRTRRADVLTSLPGPWDQRVHQALCDAGTVPAFLAAVDCNGLIAATFAHEAEQPIDRAIEALEGLVAQLNLQAL